MRHLLKRSLVVAVALAVLPASRAWSAITVRPAVSHIVKTSQWGHPSPDPAGLTYRPNSDTIFVVDSEVEETPRWEGVNVWEMTRGGAVVSQGSTMRFSDEPTDVAYSIESKRFFISDDDQDKIFIVGPGPDRTLGSTDDKLVRSFSTLTFGSHDAEGVGVGGGRLFIADGDGKTIFVLRRGPNQVFDGVAPEGDDTVTLFSTLPLGLSDPEDVDYSRANRHLYIVSRFDKTLAETSPVGVPRRFYDLSGSDILQPAGVAAVPAKAGGGQALFVADRAYDNDLHPYENDGRVFVFKPS